MMHCLISGYANNIIKSAQCLSGEKYIYQMCSAIFKRHRANAKNKQRRKTDPIMRV